MFGLFPRKRPEPSRAFVRACHVYCNPNADRAVVAAVFNHGGLLAEMPGGSTGVTLSDVAALHEAVAAALAACRFEENFDYSSQRKSDWPAYQASGWRTIKRFEAEFICLLVAGLNDQNLFYDITTPEFGKRSLRLTVTVNAHGSDFGEAVQYLVRNQLACQAAVRS